MEWRLEHMLEAFYPPKPTGPSSYGPCQARASFCQWFGNWGRPGYCSTRLSRPMNTPDPDRSSNSEVQTLSSVHPSKLKTFPSPTLTPFID